MSSTTPETEAVKRSVSQAGAAVSAARLPDEEGHAPVVTSPTLIAVAGAVAALYFGKDIFLPLAVAVLLTFALAPVVSFMRRFRIPRTAAVVMVVVAAFAAITLFGAVVATQLGLLAENLPLYQSNIENKVRVVKEANVGEGIVDRVSKLLERLGREIKRNDAPEQAAGTDQAGEPAVHPLPVEVVEPEPQPLQVLQTIIGPLIEPLATGGIIVVVVIFMLIKREDLRDRFIRLVGASDLHRTTEALQEAGKRVGQYLLMQLIVNVTYAVPIGIGLWIIGVPNALLWGLLALVLRFVPYIGPVIAAIFPILLALAVDPGWTMLAWTVALFVVVELISNNIVEPILYGSRTGLSPLAIIVAAIFWTWLWGPLGLLLSTPLTVCLVVLGRHVPQFQFLDVLFGSEPVLEVHEALYQRLLAGDPDEATDRAEEYLQENDLITFYEAVAIPALSLGETDRARGVMGEDRRRRVAEAALTLVDNLEEYTEEEAADEDEEEAPATDGDANGNGSAPEPPDGSGKTVLCAGGRGELDEAAAAMLTQVLAAHGATAQLLETRAVAAGNIKRLELDSVHSMVIGYLNRDSVAQARYVVRRLKRARGALRVGVVFFGLPADQFDEARLREAIRCDFVARSLTEAVAGALSEEKAVSVRPAPPRPIAKRRPRQRAKPKPKQAA
ncbi:MAG: AI-2E family transporter [Mesorhizobium sp.]